MEDFNVQIFGLSSKYEDTLYTPHPDVFEYLDYRAFLRDYYAERKQSRGLSFRSFSKRAGLGSPNYLKLVMEGARSRAAQGWCSIASRSTLGR